MKSAIRTLVLVAVCMVLAFSSAATAQPLSGGVRGDLVFASFRNVDHETDPRTGVRVGVYADLPTGGPVDFRAEAVYAMKGVKNAGAAPVTVKLNYIEIPVMAKVSLGRSPGLVLLTGPALGIKVSSRLVTTSGSMDYGDLVHRFDFGWVAGVGFETSLGGRGVSFDVRYTLGLRPVFDFGDPNDSDSDDKNKVLSGGVAVELF